MVQEVETWGEKDSAGNKVLSIKKNWKRYKWAKESVSEKEIMNSEKMHA